MLNNMDFDRELSRIRALFDDRLIELSSEWNSSFPLSESMKYSLFTGGKRFRPLLLLCAFNAFKGEISKEVLDFSIAVEMIHTYSLVHDDLPCMDDDDFRRGQPTVHKKYGEDIAVLTGDALLNGAYEIIFDLMACSNNPTPLIKAGKALASKTGALGLVAGQVKDLECAKRNSIREEELDFVYKHKTCDLIVSSVECGAILANATESEVEKMKEFAYNFGYAFQLVDDLLDDEINECSILKTHDKQSVRNMVTEYTERAVFALDGVSVDTEIFKYLANKSKNRTV